MNTTTKFPGATLVVEASKAQMRDFPIPGHTGKLTAAFLNASPELGPVMAIMEMAPGARIPAHYHERTAETFFVLDGDFVNAGVSYGPGAFFAVAVGDVHGPHTTTTGCRVLFAQAVQVDASDFHNAEPGSSR